MTEPRGVGDYVADSADLVLPGAEGNGVENFENPFPSCEFNWSISEVLGALRRAGLTLESFDEYPYANGWQGFEEMAELGGKRWESRPDDPRSRSCIRCRFAWPTDAYFPAFAGNCRHR
ncbi:hypothetical protein ACETU7_15825 [Rhodococcus sp. 3Y1]